MYKVPYRITEGKRSKRRMEDCCAEKSHYFKTKFLNYEDGGTGTHRYTLNSWLQVNRTMLVLMLI